LISSLEDSDGGGDAIFRSKIAIANVTTLEAGVPLTFAEFLVWLIVGLLGGSAAGMIVKRKRKGFGFFTNLALGCLGAIVGGLLFHVFTILPGLDSISISLRDVLSAFVGALVLMGLWWIWERYRGSDT
jgi:uncharacterized membrane protein YeaQ/YmgE (transglycosylase-associated protein family)